MVCNFMLMHTDCGQRRVGSRPTQRFWR